ncbi:MAG: hypothetical protein ACOCVM_06965, partial [Desulfovibrionaceae bacterium]
MKGRAFPTLLGRSRVWALRLLAAFMVAAALCAPGWAEDSLRLGINYPLTGPYSVEGLDQIR